MYTLIFVLRVYPFWAVPLAVILAETAYYFYRRRSPHQLPLWVVSGFLIVTSLVWLIFRGDQNAVTWVRIFFRLE